ncbi:MAG: hypothetical protein WDO16_14975 [Bacteroidota bacterium]
MNQVETYNSVETSLSLSPTQYQTAPVKQEVLMRTEQKSTGSLMSRSVNNYLKTVEEIETEFYVAAYISNKDISDNTGRPILKKDGYIDIPSLDEMISGTMEENY